MTEYFGTRVEEIFNTMPERFRPEGAEGFDVVMAYDITGDGGGKWTVTVRNGTVAVDKVDEIGECAVKTVTDAETFVGVSVGEIDGMAAFSSGKLKVEGDASALMASPRFFVRYSKPRKKGVAVSDIFATLVERFQPDQAEGLDIAVGYDITGDGGGQWTAVIKDGKCVLEEGLRDELTVVNTVNAKDYVDLILGKLDPMTALGAGRLKLKGDMGTAMLLPKIFAKFEPAGAEPEQELIALKKTISVNMRFATGPVMGRFFDGLKDKKIFSNRCPECGRLQLPPREVCAVCRCRAAEFVEVGHQGRLVMNDISYYASPDPLTGETRETPYGSIHVRLDGCEENADTFWHLLKREDLFDVKIGSRLRAVWSDERKGSIFDIKHFELLRD